MVRLTHVQIGSVVLRDSYGEINTGKDWKFRSQSMVRLTQVKIGNFVLRDSYGDINTCKDWKFS